MANKIVQIMQYNGSGNDNLIPLTAQQADFATNAINAQNAVIGQYASSDTSKGTIEQRLDALEYTSSSMSFVSGITPQVGGINKVEKNGNVCSFNLTVSLSSYITIASSSSLKIGTIPTEFCKTTGGASGYGYAEASNQSFKPYPVNVSISSNGVFLQLRGANSSSGSSASVDRLRLSVGYNRANSN